MYHSWCLVLLAIMLTKLRVWGNFSAYTEYIIYSVICTLDHTILYSFGRFLSKLFFRIPDSNRFVLIVYMWFLSGIRKRFPRPFPSTLASNCFVIELSEGGGQIFIWFLRRIFAKTGGQIFIWFSIWFTRRRTFAGPSSRPAIILLKTIQRIATGGVQKLNNKKDLKKVDRPPTIFGWRIGIWIYL